MWNVESDDSSSTSSSSDDDIRGDEAKRNLPKARSEQAKVRQGLRLILLWIEISPQHINPNLLKLTKFSAYLYRNFLCTWWLIWVFNMSDQNSKKKNNKESDVRPKSCFLLETNFIWIRSSFYNKCFHKLNVLQVPCRTFLRRRAKPIFQFF